MTSPAPPLKRPWLIGPGGEAARTSMACSSCRERKIKCSGIRPCRYCSKRNLNCIFPSNAKRKMYSVEYVEDLERRLQNFSANNNSKEASGTAHHSNNCVDPEEPEILTSDVTEIDSSSKASPIAPEPTMSSSLNFGSRIIDLPSRNVQDSIPSARSFVEFPDDVYDLESGRPNSPGSTAMIWPTEEEAHQLLDTVLSSIGRLQHLIDPRSFSDKLSTIYEVPEEQRQQHLAYGLWYVEILMVFALGRLLQGHKQDNNSFPGAEYFLEAVDKLPSLCALRNAGTLAIEIMGLFAFFLQCSDRKDDAYVYAGVAMRLAVSNGLARNGGSQHLKRSERTHRNRLWWTIYMQERRLAAATGNAVGIPDEAISTSLPSESPGFGPIAALNTNIKLAKLTGQIIQTLYGHMPSSERHFLRNVQQLLSELANMKRNMPTEYRLDFTKSLLISRTGATLYLMLFQAIILTTRPIILYLAKSKVEGTNIGAMLSEVSPLQSFASTCIEAAEQTLAVLHALKQQDLLARFGFFDLDAAISAAFVFILVETAYVETLPSSRSQGIRSAMDILEYLASHGNKAAEKRCTDVKGLCKHLSILLYCPQIPGNTVCATSETPSEVRAAARREVMSNIEPSTINEEEFNATAAIPDSIQNLPLPEDSLDRIDSRLMDNTEFDHSFLGAFNIDFNDDFILTSADEIDWDVFERQAVK